MDIQYDSDDRLLRQIQVESVDDEAGEGDHISSDGDGDLIAVVHQEQASLKRMVCTDDRSSFDKCGVVFRKSISRKRLKNCRMSKCGIRKRRSRFRRSFDE